MCFSESLCIIYQTVGIFRKSTFVSSNTTLHTTELLFTPKIIKFSMFCRKTSLANYAFLGEKFCTENCAGVKI